MVNTNALSPTDEITDGFRGVHMHITERIRQTEAALDRSVDRTTGKRGFDLTPPPEEGIGVNLP